MSKSLRQLLYHGSFAMSALLLFLLLMESHVEVPDWLGPLGRMHVVLLHLPIGFVFFLLILSFLEEKVSEKDNQSVQSTLLHITTLLTLLVALAGFFLTQSSAYNAEDVLWHKWVGSGLALCCFVVLMLFRHPAFTIRQYRLSLLVLTALTIWAGHLGGKLTHGADFVFGNSRSSEPLFVDDRTPIYSALVAPIFAEKCASCHRDGKAKGDLVLTSPEAIDQGGKHGPVILSEDPASSELLRRLHLPMADDDHMPPKSKVQLTTDEIEIVESWVSAGAAYTEVLADYEGTTEYVVFKGHIDDLISAQSAKYDFAPADPALIDQLNTPFRTVRALSASSPALEATIFVRATYQPSFLEELLDVSSQLVSLNLTNLPIADDALETVGRFHQLEKLILNSSDIDGNGFSFLQECENLSSLALSNCKLLPGTIADLGKLNGLQKVYLWNSGVSEEEIADFRNQYPRIELDMGYQPDPDELVQLSAPRIIDNGQILSAGDSIVIESMFAGVEIRYTTDDTDPDSTSQLYMHPIVLGSSATLKSRAYRTGWSPSDVSAHVFYVEGHAADSIELVTIPNPQYRGDGAASLQDLTMGDPSDLKTRWLGYRDKSLVADFTFLDPTPIDQVMVSCGQNIGAWVLPPSLIKVWGGSSSENLKLIASHKPVAPDRKKGTKDIKVSIAFEHAAYSVLRLEVRPVSRLPSWHQGSGQPGWAFVDEVFFYTNSISDVLE